MAEANMDLGIPTGARYLKRFNHEVDVNTIAIKNRTLHAFTAGGDYFSVCDIMGKTDQPISERYPCFEAEIWSIKITPDEKTLVVGGDDKKLSLWDISGDVPLPKAELTLKRSCDAMCISPDSKLCYVCNESNFISVWDLHNKTLVTKISGHRLGSTYIDISRDCYTLFSGGMDKLVKSWDIRKNRQIGETYLKSAICSLSCSPDGKYAAVGMKNCRVDVVDHETKILSQVKHHRKLVRSLKFAHCGKWFLSTAIDGTIIGWKTLGQKVLFEEFQQSGMMCCDISSDDAIIAVGTGTHTVIYNSVL